MLQVAVADSTLFYQVTRAGRYLFFYEASSNLSLISFIFYKKTFPKKRALTISLLYISKRGDLNNPPYSRACPASSPFFVCALEVANLRFVGESRQPSRPPTPHPFQIQTLPKHPPATPLDSVIPSSLDPPMPSLLDPPPRTNATTAYCCVHDAQTPALPDPSPLPPRWAAPMSPTVYPHPSTITCSATYIHLDPANKSPP